MKLGDLQKLIDHTIAKLGKDAPVVFLQSECSGGNRHIFDFGEQGRDNYCCRISPYETAMYVDLFGRFAIPIREMIEPRAFYEPMKTSYTPEELEELKAIGRRLWT